MKPCISLWIAASLALSLTSDLGAQGGRLPLPTPQAQKVREGVYRLGPIEVDTTKRELTVPATINKDVTTLEFVANKAGGAKAYESALTVDVDATRFNAALLLLGLDPARARVPKQHFDPVAPKGDPVEILITLASGAKTIRVEELLYDQRTKTTMTPGPWVYTGSAFMNGQFMAEVDGILIGFVHSPSPVIENPRAGGVNAYGQIILNPKIAGFVPGAKVTMTVRALGAPARGK